MLPKHTSRTALVLKRNLPGVAHPEFQAFVTPSLAKKLSSEQKAEYFKGGGKHVHIYIYIYIFILCVCVCARTHAPPMSFLLRGLFSRSTHTCKRSQTRCPLTAVPRACLGSAALLEHLHAGQGVPGYAEAQLLNIRPKGAVEGLPWPTGPKTSTP